MSPPVITGGALDWLAAFVERRSATPEQAALLQLVVTEGRRQSALLPRGLPAAELPLAVYSAAGGPDPAPLALAGACLCVYLGADLLDNVVDRELLDHWVEIGANQALLAGVTFLTPLAAAALAELDAPVGTQLAVQDALVRGLLIMSAGQSADVNFEDRSDVTLAACEEMVLAKTGAEGALFAHLGAILARAPSAVCDNFATFGRELGATIQLLSDAADLALGVDSRDLAAGKRTLPVVYALSTLPNDSRDQLLGQLAAAPRDTSEKLAARDALLAAGALHFCILVAEAHRQQALTALRCAAPAGPMSQHLYDWAEEFRFAPVRPVPDNH